MSCVEPQWRRSTKAAATVFKIFSSISQEVIFTLHSSPNVEMLAVWFLRPHYNWVFEIWKRHCCNLWGRRLSKCFVTYEYHRNSCSLLHLLQNKRERKINYVSLCTIAVTKNIYHILELCWVPHIIPTPLALKRQTVTNNHVYRKQAIEKGALHQDFYSLLWQQRPDTQPLDSSLQHWWPPRRLSLHYPSTSMDFWSHFEKRLRCKSL